jgi:hypothetical protein
MARTLVTKIDILSRIYKWKNTLYDRKAHLSPEAKHGYDEALNDVLEFLKEYRD